MMSIADFAERTGIVPSALRFYESKGILVPAERQANGYRTYGDHQIHEAKLVNSLRQAGISLNDIRGFLESDEETRSRLLERWRREAEARILSVQIASQYLNGMEPGPGSLHLVRWDEPLTLLWQPYEVHKPVHSYSLACEHALPQLRQAGIRPQGTGLIRVLDSRESSVLIEVGYQLGRDPNAKCRSQSLPPEAYLETLPPTLFVSVDSSWEDIFICMRTIRFLEKFGFKPSGKRIERHFEDSDSFEILIPVMQSTMG
ncbi:MerR family transcriptional regulator [Paenibacillus sp. FSL M8-0142]|uniref:helix-turn-helix domain-containing protein n=1 Tax=Paenibacillus sp. FSL M8-0142 TaxID=2954525 RepID=UPI00315B245F